MTRRMRLAWGWSMALTVGLAQAQYIEALGLQRQPEPLKVDAVVTVRDLGAMQPCGLELDFGDGQKVKQRADPGQPLTVSHVYAQPGGYVVTVRGAFLKRGLNSVSECQGATANLTALLDAKLTQDGSLDVLVLAIGQGRRGNALFARNIDGTPRLTEGRPYADVNDCLVQNLRGRDDQQSTADQVMAKLAGAGGLHLISVGELYQQAQADGVRGMALARTDRLLKALGFTGRLQTQCGAKGYVDMDNLSAGDSDVVLVPRAMLPHLKTLPSFAALGQARELGVLTLTEMQQAMEAGKRRKEAAEQAQAAARAELATLAEARSKAKVGSLVLSLDLGSKKELKLCTLSYKGDDAIAVMGFRAMGGDMLLPDLRDRAARERWQLGSGDRFDRAFADINEAFIKLSNDPSLCHLFIDYPANLQALRQALARDRGIQTSVGNLVAAESARERLATQRGFVDLAEMKFAQAIGADATQIKTLKAQAAGDAAGYLAAQTELKKAGYAAEDDLRTVLAYLKDREDGKARQLTAVAQRDARQETARKEAADREAARQRQREAYAREYPFEAMLQCGFQGQHTNIQACFAGFEHAADTELEVRNGQDYGMYKAWELARAGREDGREGFKIPLRGQFAIKAQNSSNTLTLTLVVRETGSGRVVYTKSAAQYGVVSFRN